MSTNMRKRTAELILIASLGFQPCFVHAHPPSGIVVDKEGSVYFLKFVTRADDERGQLWKLAPDRTLTNIPETHDGRRLSRPHKLAIDSSDGTLYIGAADRFVKVSPDGSVSTLDFSKGPPPFRDSPLAVDQQGNLYYYSIGLRSERSQNLRQLVRIDARGESHIVAGSTEGHRDGTGEDAQFVHMQAIAAGPSGELYVADGDGRTGSWIRRVAREGIVTTIAGSSEVGWADGRESATRFQRLGGLSIDEEGSLYVADPFNERIRKVTQDAVVTTFAGSGAAGDTDGPAAEASFTHPSGVAVGPDGDVYVLDGSAKVARVRRISPDASVVTIAVVR
ncbi:MAG: hypothetical protein WD229_03425 [Pirellulales bacterium]